MGNITTVQMKKETRERLKTFKIIPRESYDALINRLLAKE